MQRPGSPHFEEKKIHRRRGPTPSSSPSPSHPPPLKTSAAHPPHLASQNRLRTGTYRHQRGRAPLLRAMALLLLLAYAALAVAALSHRSALHALRRLWRWADDQTQAYQLHQVPRRLPGAEGVHRENPLFLKAAAYVSSLPSLEDADAVSVLSSSANKTHGGFSLRLGPGHTARDAFLGARLAWTCLAREDGEEALVLRVRRHDRARVLRPYLQHVESVADDMELRRRELRLFVNVRGGVDGAPRWASAPFAHPATLDAVAMDPDLKARVRADLESFAKGRAYYHRLGRVWRRSYLLHGPPGTGKSTFAAAMARFLGYDVYDVDLSRADVDLRALLMHTTPRSLILLEDLDRHLQLQDHGAEARVLSFMDGVASCCGEERVMVFTMRGVAPLPAAVARPGRLDVHVRFTLCDFEAFKALAGSYLGLTDHKLFPQVEEGFQAAGERRPSPAELGEIMLANRASSSRALRTVITRLQHERASEGSAAPTTAPPRMPHRRITSWSGAGQWDGGAEEDAGTTACAGGGVLGKDAAPMRELKKLYGLIKTRSRKDGPGVAPSEEGEATAAVSGRWSGSGSNHGMER
ncbi:AAA-ATPase At2g46620 [Aegilops tauschii subsp. strangulata]|nr:AAA-ATPase At2g46620 [Aegilops tauschii subsp. strangulata]